MIDLESIQNHSRMVQGPPGHQKTSKTINLDPQMLRKKIKKIIPKLINLMGFGTQISQIFHAGACVACGSLSGDTSNDS